MPARKLPKLSMAERIAIDQELNPHDYPRRVEFEKTWEVTLVHGPEPSALPRIRANELPVLRMEGEVILTHIYIDPAKPPPIRRARSSRLQAMQHFQDST